MRYRDLRPTRPDDALRRLVAEARSNNTRPHGVKIAGPGDSIAFPGRDGDLRVLDADHIDQIQDQIAAGTGDIAQANERLEAAEVELAASRDRITETRGILSALDAEAVKINEQAKAISQQMATDRAEVAAAALELEDMKPRLGSVEFALTQSEQRLALAETAASDASAAAESAKTTADSLQAKLDAALKTSPGLITDPSFETPESWQPAYGSSIKADSRASSGANVWYVPPKTVTGYETAHAYTRSATAKVVQGHKYRITVRVMLEAAPDRDSLRMIYRAGDPLVYKGIGGALTLSSQNLAVGQWALIQWDWEAPETATYSLGIQAGYHSVGKLVDDFQVVDITEQADLALQVANAKQAAADAASKAADAATKAGQAVTSAAGKATIQHKTTTPQGVGVAVGDTWMQWDRFPGGVIIAQWTWDGSAWRPQQLSHQVLSSVDLGKATVGELNGSYIKANSLEADRLTIGIGGNALADPAFSSQVLTAERAANAVGTWTQNRAGATPYVVSTSTTSAVSFRFAGAAVAKAMPTVGGQRWRISVPVNPGGGQTRINVRWFNAAGSSFYVAASPYITGTTLTEISTIWEAPAAAVSFLVDVYSSTAATARSVQVHAGASVRSMTGAVHIEDGSITGQKVNAEEVAAAIGKFVKVEAENVKVTNKLAASVLSAVDTNTVNAFVEKNLIVGEEGVLNVLGQAIVKDLNVRKNLRGRDAIFDGTVDVDQLNVTETMTAKLVDAMAVETKKLVVTEAAVMQHVTAIKGIVTPDLTALEGRIGTLLAGKASIADLGAGNLTLAGHFRSGEVGKPGVVIPSAYVTSQNLQQLGVWLSHNGTAPSLGAEWGATGGMWIDQQVMKGGSSADQSSPLYLRGQNGAGVRIMGGLAVGDSNGNAIITPVGGGNVVISARLGDADLRAGRYANLVGVSTANVITSGDLYLKGGSSIRLVHPNDSPYARSWTGGGLKTVYMGGSSGIVYTETSTARAKVDVETAEPDHEWLDMRTVTYRDRIAVELQAEIEARRAAGDCTPLTAEEHERLAISDRRIPGRIAEEGVGVADAQVVLDGSGQVEGWDYSRDAVMLTPHVREHRDKIAALEARLEALEGAAA